MKDSKRSVQFSKYQGLGNDFILVNGRGWEEEALQRLSSAGKTLCDRRFGIGADGVILLLDGSNECKYTMQIINSDGTEAEMCGNGIRCLAKFIDELDSQTSAADGDSNKCSISTLAGKIITEILPDGSVCVDMGPPSLLPWSTKKEKVDQNSPPYKGFSLVIDEDEYEITDVSMGNPHAVAFVKDLASFHSSKLFDVGPRISQPNDMFPNGANAEFVEAQSHCHLKVEVWERGSGHTQACGTGACAAVVAGIMREVVDRSEWCTVTLPGGDLKIKWEKSDGHVYMIGPASSVFEGTISI